MADKTEMTGWHVEHYTLDADRAVDDAEGDDERKVRALFGLGQYGRDIWEKGLIFLANQAVFHHFGYALGINLSEPDEDGVREQIGFIIARSDDPDGIIFDEETIVKGREKLRRAFGSVDDAQRAAIAEGFRLIHQARKQRQVDAGAERIEDLLAQLNVEPENREDRMVVATTLAKAVLEGAGVH